MVSLARSALPVVILALGLSACSVFRAPATPTAAGGAQTAETPSGTARPSPEIPAAPTPAPPAPAPPPHHQFQLGPAASALVAQSHTQAKGGDTAQAGATLERALRIEPDNPLLWIELGRLQLQENNAAQADAMGRKALALASGDASAQASAWRLIADSLRVRGRNQEAADAERRAASFAPH